MNHNFKLLFKNMHNSMYIRTHFNDLTKLIYMYRNNRTEGDEETSLTCSSNKKKSTELVGRAIQNSTPSLLPHNSHYHNYI